MKPETREPVTPPRTLSDERPSNDLCECPEVLTHGDARVLFGPGLDDFNAFDDPC